MSGTKFLLLFYAIQTLIFGIPCIALHPEDSRSACVEGLTDLINEEETLLYLSTLDGTFIGVNRKNGDVLWQFKEEAAVKVPNSDQNALSPMFLPDPRDGSLYLLDSQNRYDLKKLQFTIQQLVTSSPCRSSDGIFYTGKKIDNWFMIDWRTGTKEALLNSDGGERVCPLMNRNNMFLGRTEYNLIIQDVSSKERRWNVTFYDYAADILSPEKMKNQDHVYFAGSSTGKFAVFKSAGGGSFLWEANFGSPVIGVYSREGDRLVSLPFTTMDDNSLPFNGLESIKQVKFSSTLYVGTHTHGLYALPALATSDSTVLLLNGPSSDDTISVPMVKENESIALLGYYEIPHDGIKRLQISGRSDAVIDMNDTVYGANTSSRSTTNNIAVQTDESKSYSPKWDRHLLYQIVHIGVDYILSAHNIELKIFMVTMLSMMLCMFVYFRAQVREFKQSSSSGYSRISNSGSAIVTCVAEELPNGSTKVGKILFNSNHILGKGCEGTFVFKGEFDNRPVAVKRLLPECFTVADREVCLLRESDQHPNVIRYFCMEQDKQFRYIALELCSATLQEYTEKGVLNDRISPKEALSQAAAGLEYLHALNIVHRDIKPHNVLLSFPANMSSETKVRAMISDFGLCKKLQTGKASFSRKSGITGTDGWIAPEIIHGRGRTTAAVDIFSMGCVFYYVLSRGKHPFGDSLSRQANIMDGKYKLNDFVQDKYELWSHLVSKMVTLDPLERPLMNVIKNHPAFWTKDQTLSFLQDVSDRIEKEDTSSKVLLELEMGNSIVLNGDWRDQIEPEIAEDLRKYRSYRADSVRDLLRALRNKKHHYRELSETVREILGCIPDQFVSYWLDRFPKLLLHTWLAMQCVRQEGVFSKYYSNGYQFPCIHDGVIPGWIQQGLNMSPRWKFLNKNVGSSPKYGGPPRYAGGGGSEKSNTPFFSMSNGGGDKTLVYNWRQRPKVVTEEDAAVKPADDGVVAAVAAAAAADGGANNNSVEVVVTNADEENDCGETKENVKPTDNGEDEEVEEEEGEEGKWQKKVRHRRPRRKRKIVHLTLPVQS